MLTRGSKLWALVGVHLRISFSCSLGEFRAAREVAPIHLNPDTSLATNIIVSSMLILGGSATVTALSGMSTIAVSGGSHSDLTRLIERVWCCRLVSSFRLA